MYSWCGIDIKQCFKVRNPAKNKLIYYSLLIAIVCYVKEVLKAYITHI